MASRRFSALVVLALAAVSVLGENLKLDYNYYCSEDLMCSDGIEFTSHLLCNVTTEFSPKCLEAEYVPLSDTIRKLFVKEHNRLRNEQALGHLGGMFSEQAADMATTSWDDELELMAIQNLMQCEMKHDDCIRTSKYTVGGQNLFRGGTSGYKMTIEDAVKDAIQGWFAEYKQVPNIKEVSELSPSSSHGRKIGHWTQLVKSNADRIGCSAVRYSEYKKSKKYAYVAIACNYNTGNMLGDRIYSIGEAGSLCQTGTNSEYPGLCSTDEDYAQHENGEYYFNAEPSSSPVIEQWLKNGKKLDISISNALYVSLPTLPTNQPSFGPKPVIPKLNDDTSASWINTQTTTIRRTINGKLSQIQVIIRNNNGKISVECIGDGSPINEKDCGKIVLQYNLLQTDRPTKQSTSQKTYFITIKTTTSETNGKITVERESNGIPMTESDYKKLMQWFPGQ